MFRDWTLDETLFVRDYAGTVPLSDLARHLRRDARDVAGECARLGVPFVYVGTPLFWCDECAELGAEGGQVGPLRQVPLAPLPPAHRGEDRRAHGAPSPGAARDLREVRVQAGRQGAGRPAARPGHVGNAPEGGRRSRYGLFGRPERLGGGKGIPSRKSAQKRKERAARKVREMEQLCQAHEKGAA